MMINKYVLGATLFIASVCSAHQTNPNAVPSSAPLINTNSITLLQEVKQYRDLCHQIYHYDGSVSLQHLAIQQYNLWGDMTYLFVSLPLSDPAAKQYLQYCTLWDQLPYLLEHTDILLVGQAP